MALVIVADNGHDLIDKKKVTTATALLAHWYRASSVPRPESVMMCNKPIDIGQRSMNICKPLIDMLLVPDNGTIWPDETKSAILE